MHRCSRNSRPDDKLDVGVNKLFKVNLGQCWNKWMLDGNHTFTPAGCIHKPALSQICQWIVDSWKTIFFGKKWTSLIPLLMMTEWSLSYAGEDEVSVLDVNEKNTVTFLVKVRLMKVILLDFNFDILQRCHSCHSCLYKR